MRGWRFSVPALVLGAVTALSGSAHAVPPPGPVRAPDPVAPKAHAPKAHVPTPAGVVGVPVLLWPTAASVKGVPSVSARGRHAPTETAPPLIDLAACLKQPPTKEAPIRLLEQTPEGFLLAALGCLKIWLPKLGLTPPAAPTGKVDVPKEGLNLLGLLTLPLPSQADVPGQVKVPGRADVPGQAEVPSRAEAPSRVEVPGRGEAPNPRRTTRATSSARVGQGR